MEKKNFKVPDVQLSKRGVAVNGAIPGGEKWGGLGRVGSLTDPIQTSQVFFHSSAATAPFIISLCLLNETGFVI